MTTSVSTVDVLLFYPNLIGYLRVTCMVLSFYFITGREWQLAFFCYGLAFFGDVVDGFVARKFNQSSEFGGILDMITDRVSTCGLIALLIPIYTEYAFPFVMLIVLDISSHWMHVMSVRGHHKSAESLDDRDVSHLTFSSGFCILHFHLIAMSSSLSLFGA